MNLKQAAEAAAVPVSRVRSAITRGLLVAAQDSTGCHWKIEPGDLEKALHVTAVVGRVPLEPRRVSYQKFRRLKASSSGFEEFATNAAEKEYLTLQARRPGVMIQHG